MELIEGRMLLASGLCLPHLTEGRVRDVPKVTCWAKAQLRLEAGDRK